MVKFEIKQNDTMKHIECKNILWAFDIIENKVKYSCCYLRNDIKHPELIHLINRMIESLDKAKNSNKGREKIISLTKKLWNQLRPTKKK